ncbi:MAG: VTT domain-containing protein [Bryobacterales bacterium]|nr:VTT domain-containing protein [Bryobacterales bacterium]
MAQSRLSPKSAPSRRSLSGPVLRWGLATLLLAAAVLVPFWLLDEPLATATGELLMPGSSWAVTASLVVLLLAADVLLPVPSSLVLTASGLLLGMLPGLAAGWVGLQCGALVGYALGRFAGSRIAVRLVGADELDRASRAWRRWGDAALVAARAVPVLAESTVVLAGVAGMPPARFALLAGCSNAGIAAVYAGVGARARGLHGFLAAFAAALLVPGALMLAARYATVVLPGGKRGSVPGSGHGEGS